jgi:hypothetical protein
MVEVEANLRGDVAGALDKYEESIRQDVLFSGAAAMARVVYAELKRNTSGSRFSESEQSFVGAGKKTSTLHDAVYRTYSPSRSTDQVKTYHVGVNKKKAPHWALIEYGHMQPYRAVLTQKRGWITL